MKSLGSFSWIYPLWEKVREVCTVGKIKFIYGIYIFFTRLEDFIFQKISLSKICVSSLYGQKKTNSYHLNYLLCRLYYSSDHTKLKLNRKEILFFSYLANHIRTSRSLFKGELNRLNFESVTNKDTSPLRNLRNPPVSVFRKANIT